MHALSSAFVDFLGRWSGIFGSISTIIGGITALISFLWGLNRHLEVRKLTRKIKSMLASDRNEHRHHRAPLRIKTHKLHR